MDAREFMSLSLAEDIGRGDLFERTIESAFYSAKVISKEDGVFAGELYAKALFSLFSLECEFLAKDGDSIKKGDTLLTIKGLNVDILKLERTLLNALQHASGIATKASLFASLARRCGVTVLDTRKTRPLLRGFEKYAARVGGVTNHRFGLDDALMIKDTHLKTISDLKAYVQKARKSIPFTSKIEIECESLQEAKEAITIGADIIMCDNMSVEEVRKVVEFKNITNNKILIECSGNMDEKGFAAYAEAGVDAISVGKIIHQATWLDFSMKGA